MLPKVMIFSFRYLVHGCSLSTLALNYHVLLLTDVHGYTMDSSSFVKSIIRMISLIFVYRVTCSALVDGNTTSVVKLMSQLSEAGKDDERASA
jgi:hypothetical protein